MATLQSVYAPQTGLDSSIKDSFYDGLLFLTSGLPDNKIAIPCGDWNGHFGKDSSGYVEIHWKHDLAECNNDGVLDFAAINYFVINNTFFVKRKSPLTTYQSGPSQIDFILMCKQHLKLIKDIKVIPSIEF